MTLRSYCVCTWCWQRPRSTSATTSTTQPIITVPVLWCVTTTTASGRWPGAVPRASVTGAASATPGVHACGGSAAKSSASSNASSSRGAGCAIRGRRRSLGGWDTLVKGESSTAAWHCMGSGRCCCNTAWECAARDPFSEVSWYCMCNGCTLEAVRGRACG
eukprot:363845-Chlamydomonas_euryale.AAC.4